MANGSTIKAKHNCCSAALHKSALDSI